MKRLHILPITVILGGCFWHLNILWNLYDVGYFQFHDLTLINDWFSNAIFIGRPFFITATNYMHLSYGLTPTLIILAPLYALFESQFILLVLNVLALGLGLFYIYLFSCRLIERYYISPVIWSIFISLLLAQFLLNRYLKIILLSAHYEIFYLPAFAMLAYVYVCDSRRMISWVALFLCIFISGIRQDAGFYLALHLLGLCVALWDFRSLSKLFLLAGLSLTLSIMAIFWIMPALGEDLGGLRFWGHLGQGPIEIITTIIIKPGMVAREIWYSGARLFHNTHGHLYLYTPYSLFMNLPAIPLYLIPISNVGKKMLLLYNATFLLPAMWCAVICGCLNLLRFFSWLAGRRRIIHHIMISLLLCTLLYSLKELIRFRERLPYGDIGVVYQMKQAVSRRRQFKLALRSLTQACPEIKAVAANEHDIVFLPNSFQKYLLSQPAKSTARIIRWDDSRQALYLKMAIQDGLVSLRLNADHRVFLDPFYCKSIDETEWRL